MGNLSNRSIHSVFGCPNASETTTIDIIGASGYMELEANEMYRITTTTDCFMSMDSASGVLAEASGVRMFPVVPEVFSTTGKLYHLNTVQDVTGGASTGKMTVTKMLTRGV
jgi:hypothetical protein